MKIKIDPVGKPRQTRSDKWKLRPAVVRYRNFADELRLKYRQELPNNVKLIFFIAMPKSWSCKKCARMDGKPHQQRPDLDNLVKAVADALMSEDSTIWRCMSEKYWATEGGIDITPLDPEK